MIRVAMLSRWHVHADDYAEEIQNNDNVSIQLVWDERKDRGREWAAELGVPFEADLKKVLADPAIDAVVVATPTDLHKEVIQAAAANDKHIFTEKVLALTVQDCEDIYETVDQHEVELMVSLPKLIERYYLYAQKAVDEGWLGKVTSIRCRMAHNGAVPGLSGNTGWLPEHFFDKEQAGGGALIDLGAHPIYLTNRLGGKVTALSALMQQTHNLGVDDNTQVLVEYESGALGIIETSFVSQHSPFQLELYGTEGTLLIEENDVRIKSEPLGLNDWSKPHETIRNHPMPMDQWIAAIKEKATPSIQRSDVINLTLINEKAVQANERGCWIRV